MEISDAAYRNLLAELETASEREALIAAAMFLEAIGVERRLLKPLESIIEKLLTTAIKARSGGRLRPIRETHKLARAAALVTYRSRVEGHTVKAALEMTAKDFDVSARKIENFRDEIHRGRASFIAKILYTSALEDDEFLRTGKLGVD